MSWAVSFTLRLFLVALGVCALFQGASVLCQHLGIERDDARFIAAMISGGLGFLALAVSYKDPT
jgi:hypothetical protein